MALGKQRNGVRKILLSMSHSIQRWQIEAKLQNNEIFATTWVNGLLPLFYCVQILFQASQNYV
jgi:hypothetical protein